MNPITPSFKEPARPQEWRHGYPLITPSASPPVSRSFLSANRLASRASAATGSASTPPPTKRTNRTATPFDPNFDLHEARKASATRVWDVWSQLEERYTRRIDEDDIIDLRTNSVIKDRGILRGLTQQYDIGTFAEADANDAASEGGGGQTEGEDDVDEIDAFAPEADLSVNAYEIPPPRELDPEDVEEFLEAERKRKELYGDEDEEASDSISWPAVPSRRMEVIEEIRETIHEEVTLVRSEVEESVRSEPDWGRSESIQDPPLEENQDEDADELDEWTVDESSVLYLVGAHNAAHNEYDEDKAAAPAASTSTIIPKPTKSNEDRPADIFSPEPPQQDEDSSLIDLGPHTDPGPSKLSTKKSKPRKQTGRAPSFVQQDLNPQHRSVPDAPANASAEVPRSPKKKQRMQVEVVISSRPPKAKGKGKALSSPRPRSPSPSPGPSRAYLAEAEAHSISQDTQKALVKNEGAARRSKTKKQAVNLVTDDDAVPGIPASAKGKGKALPPRSPSPPSPTVKVTRSRLRNESEAVELRAQARRSESKVPPAPRAHKRKRVSDESARGESISFTRLASTCSSPELDDGGYISSSEGASGEDSDAEPSKPFRSSLRSRSHPPSRARSRAPSRARSHAPTFPPLPPRDTSFQPDPTTQAQAQYLLVQAMHHLSYLISATPAPGVPPLGWAPPTTFPPLPSYPFPQEPRPPQTPSHRHRSRSRHRSAALAQSSSSSSPTRPSSSSILSTPSHTRHPLPHSYDPAYSRATLPPSSPPLSSPRLPQSPDSPIDWEEMRPKSARYTSPSKDTRCRSPVKASIDSSSPSKGRSKSRGRKVSFKLSVDEAPSRGRKGKGKERDKDRSDGH
ncbi:hypothetical protein OE88DRAFT_1807440 [Heliocybe sulcata]|uniref:Uncharacterized protein n=1 Tax=Heliocybe sulcata TaxID=5364 RepID=A0A5C3N671_9AGAM|nr:hypothetical protein OE88DRAFT_1807440 [Heliocybe sulcata]